MASIAAWMASMTLRAPPGLRWCIEKSHRDRRAPAPGSAPSCDAMALPERRDVLIRDGPAPQRLFQGRFLCVAEHIGARPTRLDLARQLSKFILVFLWPALYPAQNLFCGFFHGS